MASSQPTSPARTRLPTSNPFDNLPIETNQHIASFIEHDIDLCNFRLVCQSTHDAIDSDNLSFWRRRFLAHFEKFTPNSKGRDANLEHKTIYEVWRRQLKYGALFDMGRSDAEVDCLMMVVDLMLDAFSEKGANDSTYESPNMALVKRFVEENNVLHTSAKPSSRVHSRQSTSVSRNTGRTLTSLLQTVQVMCAPMLLRLDGSLGLVDLGFNLSQATVYSTAENTPIFNGPFGMTVNIDYVLHSINFWKHHMLRPEEGTLHRAYSKLLEKDRPRLWNSQLKQGVSTLGKHWKGCYAYIGRDEIAYLRHHGEDALDCFAGEEGAYQFQDLTLDLVHDKKDIVWPKVFEQHFRNGLSSTCGPKTRAQKRSPGPESVADHHPQCFHFAGDGEDVDELFMASGWLSALPQQERIPGWQRMTMMKYFVNDDGSLDEQSLWAYEGVVLPGGQIIIGRWWYPNKYEDDDEEFYSGPFIFWGVEAREMAAKEEA